MASILVCFLLLAGYISFSRDRVRRSSKPEIGDAPICGLADDGSARLPVRWDDFTPPEKGATYQDPVFGCTIVRLTNSILAGVSEHHYYSTLTPINADDSKVLIGDEHGNRRIVDMTGNVVISSKQMPRANAGTVLWDARDGSIFYFTRGNSLMRGQIRGKSVRSSVVHEFQEYQTVLLPDKTDLSIDGQSFAMWGGHTAVEGHLEIFTFNMSTNHKKPAYITKCMQVVAYIQGACVHGITQTADDNVIIGFANDGNCTECGNRLWNGTQLVSLQDGTNHIDTGYDLNGRSIFIEVGRESTLPGERNPCPGGWGLDVRVLADLTSAACLLDKQPSWHVSYRGSASQPWVALSFFDDRKSGPELFSNNPSYQLPSKRNWQRYEDEIILTRIDGSGRYRMAQARSRSAEGYWAEPRAAISRDGRFVVFDSNMAYAEQGCPSGVEDCTDVYLIRVR